VFARDPDSLLIFTRHEMEDAFTVEATLRNFKPIEPFCVRWQFPLMGRDGELDPARLKQSKGGRKRTHAPEQLCAAIIETTAENPTRISAWAVAAKIPRQTLQDYLPGLRAKRWIATSGEGSSARQFITEKGREAVQEYNEGAS